VHLKALVANWRRITSIGALMLLLAAPSMLLVSCEGQPPPPVYAPLVYDYLPKLKLKVGSIDIDNAFAQTNTDKYRHVEALAPVQPADALARMARDRLVQVGVSGHAVFIIEDASLIRTDDGFAGKMAVRLEVATADGTKSGFAEAQVSRTYATVDTSELGTRDALYKLVKLMMDDMNVEFEFEVKKKLHDYLDEGDASVPAPIQSQDLGPTPPPPPAAKPLTN
jgi:hypothetical protein